MKDLNNALTEFNELNSRMNGLVVAKIQSVFGTPAERTLLRDITRHGIEAAGRIIELIESGLTYDKWKDYLNNENDMKGVLGLFENEQGDVAKLVDDFLNTDLRSAYEALDAQGFFTVENIDRDRQTLVKRLEWAEGLWVNHDKVDADLDVLKEIGNTPAAE